MMIQKTFAALALVASGSVPVWPATTNSTFSVSGSDDANCECAGGSISVFNDETIAKESDEYCTGCGCIGGCGGTRFEGHASGQTVETFTFWPNGGAADGASALYWKLTNGDEFTVGHAQGSKCSWTFKPGDHFIGNIGLHGDGVGTRLGRIEFNVAVEATGEVKNFACGTAHTKRLFPADGKVLSGFFGQSGDDIDHLGLLLKDKQCEVISREITDIKCVTPQGSACGAVWVGSGATDTAHGICDWCKESNSGTCGAQFTLSESHTVSTSVTTSGEVDTSTSIADEISLEFLGEGGKSTETFSVTFKSTWGESKSQTISTTSQIASTCSLAMQPHTKSIFDATASIGKLTADIEITITTKDRCGTAKVETKSGKVEIDHVPITALVSECSPHDATCDTLV